MLNVATERQDTASMLSLYRALVSLRRARPELALGGYMLVSVADDLLVYAREHQDQRSLVALNLGMATISLEVRGHVLLSTFMDRQAEVIDGLLSLRGAEGIVIEHSS